MSESRRIITKDGIVESEKQSPQEDLEAAEALVASAGWGKYFTRKLRERRDRLKDDLAVLASDNVSDFHRIQAKIAMIDEILEIPAIDIRNLRKSGR